MIATNADPSPMSGPDARLAEVQSELRSLRQELAALEEDEFLGRLADASKLFMTRRRVEALEAESKALCARADLASGLAGQDSMMGSARKAAADFLTDHKLSAAGALIIAGTVAFLAYFQAQGPRLGPTVHDQEKKMAEEFFNEGSGPESGTRFGTFNPDK